MTKGYLVLLVFDNKVIDLLIIYIILYAFHIDNNNHNQTG